MTGALEQAVQTMYTPAGMHAVQDGFSEKYLTVLPALMLLRPLSPAGAMTSGSESSSISSSLSLCKIHQNALINICSCNGLTSMRIW